MLTREDRYRFEDFVADTARMADADGLYKLLSRAVGQYGFDQLVFSAPFDPELPADLNHHGIFQSYPADWQAYYLQHDCARIDPVLGAAAIRRNAFTWDDLEKTSTYTPQQTRFMRLSEEAGLNHGVGVPLRNGRTLIAGIGLASSQRLDATQPHLDLLDAICTQFYISFKRLHARPDAAAAVFVSLSGKETEILTWVAAGKTDDDIGQILGISRNTVDTHMRHIFYKLDASNRVTAVVKGLLHGYIRP